MQIRIEALMGFPYLYYIVWQRLMALLAANRIAVNIEQPTIDCGCVYLSRSPKNQVELEWGFEVAAEEGYTHLFITVRPVDGIGEITVLCRGSAIGETWKVASADHEGGSNLPPGHFIALLGLIQDGGEVSEGHAFRYLEKFLEYFKSN